MNRTPLRRSGRRAATWTLVVGVLTVVGLGAVTAGYLTIGHKEGKLPDVLMHTVKRGRFVHDVLERGEVESSSNVEIRCEVESKNSNGTAILDVLPEGTRVEAGTVLVRLDSSALEQEFVQQKILCNTSQALFIQAQNDYEASKIAKVEYEEGTYRQEEQLIQSELFVAQENLRRAQEYLKYSERLWAKGYVTALQLEGDRFAVDKAENEVHTARTKLRVLQEYTKPKMLMTLEATIKTNKAKWEAEQESYQLELSKLKDIEEQIAKCVIRAPQPGTVVYANKESRRSDSEFVVEPGSLVLERQVIIRLPDPRHMQVKAEISESRVTLIKPGMPVTIGLDAFEDEELRGEVVKVNEYPEPGSWFSSQVKEYATFIKIFDPPPLLRPGLTAEVRIHVAEKENALQVPVQAIHEHGEKLYCMVRKGTGWVAQEVELEASNDKFVLLQSGVEENDKVAMNPRALVDQVNLPKLVEKPRDTVAAQEPGPGAADTSEPQGPSTEGNLSASSDGVRPQGDIESGTADDADRPETIAGQIMGRLDADGDGRLSDNELSGDEAEAFADADTNQDGAIDRSELTSAVTRGMANLEPSDGGPAGGALP